MRVYEQKRRPTRPEVVHRKTAGNSEIDASLDVDSAVRAAARVGSPLPDDLRTYFEPRFGHDFSAVRIHTGDEEAQGARAIQARAYTVGRDIVFGSGEYAPATEEGRRLLAHELTHVVQQDGAQDSAPRIRRDPAPKKPAPPPKFTPRPMKLEDVVKEMSGLGGPYKDLKAWTDSMKAGKFLGHPIDQGVRPEFQQLLDSAEKKVKDEYKKSGATIPSNFGIRFIGGFRSEISPHGAGVAIDIDGGDNPYIMHEGDDYGYDTTLTKELRPVLHRIAEFILNDPIDGEQSVIPKLITTGDTLPKGGKATRRERVGQYYDRLAKESDAMHRYFTMMRDDAALKAFLDGDWKTTHPKQTPPALADVKKQMWDDFALLGGEIPKGGPPGISDFKPPRAAGRPFHPLYRAQKDPTAGFLTIPKEVVVGLSQTVPRWGAIDFGPQSGDVMHFDDRYGVGKPFEDAKAPAKAKVDAENQKAKEAFDKAQADEKAAAEKAAAEKAAAGQGSGSGSAAPPPQRKAIVGAVDDPAERQADEMADRVLRMDRPPARAVAPRGAASPVVVRRRIIPTDVSKELVGQQFKLRKAFVDGAVSVPAGEIVTVVMWNDSDANALVSSPSAIAMYSVPKHLLEPAQTKVAGISPYGVGLAKVESEVETGAAKLEAFKKTEPQYKTAKGKAFFAKEKSEREAEQQRIEAKLNIRLIQATMLNRFDPIIKKWVDHYNTQFGFTGKDALDPNLIKAMVYQESQMGTYGDFMSDPTTNPIMTRFNILQAIDSWPEEQLLVIPEMAASLISKYHLENIQQDLLKVETELDDLKEKVRTGKAKTADVTRLNELKAQSENNWQPWFNAYKAPGQTQGFLEAAIEFLNTVDGGKKHQEDYDFWIRVGVRAVFEKHKHVSSWAEAARAYNGGGPNARKYRDEVVQRAEQAVKSEKAGKEFIPERL